jgi:hypothetical protein
MRKRSGDSTQITSGVFLAYQSGSTSLNDAVCSPPAAFLLVDRMLSTLDSKFATLEERVACIGRFFRSDHFRSVPAVRVSASFLATIAREVHSGRSADRFPKGGIFNDIDAVAAYSLFCDAMFVDKEISHFARQQELKKELSANGRLFSLRQNEKLAFIAYLEGIEADASAEHLRLIEEVYGPNWPTPFEELLSVVQERTKRKTR